MNGEMYPAKAGEKQALVEVESARAIQEVQAAMVIAKKFPRDIEFSRQKIKEACQRKTLAKDAMYAYNKGGTMISDASIRLAEVIEQNWGNMISGIREIAQGEDFSEVEAFAWDLETNVKDIKTFRVKHERKARGSFTKISDPREVYEHVANLGTRRKRACILAIIPRDIKEDAIKWCEEALEKDEAPLKERVRAMLDKFSELGVDKAMIEKRINHKIDAIIPQELVSLGKIFNSINDGMSTREDWFSVPAAEQTPATKDLDKQIDGLGEGEPEKSDGEGSEGKARQQVIDLLKETFDEAVISRAKKEMQMSTGKNTWPPTAQGVNKLFGKCQEIFEKESEK